MLTFFFQNVKQFFDVIFHAIYDPKPQLRESAANALRMALVVTSQRETTSHTREGEGVTLHGINIALSRSDLFISRTSVIIKQFLGAKAPLAPALSQ